MESENEKITRIDIETTMKTAYIDYAMSVIVSRALPDVRDGMKPVHRRILFSMNENGNYYNTPTKKSARIVGDVMGKYHPHGDSSIYGALVRLAQPWAMRYPLVDGQGNFGSIDGDGPAAMRYTEARMKQIANEMVADIDEDTVDMMPTYDNEGKEPTVLPAKIPNLLINGSNGIAVGMATNMPTHNLREVLNGCIAFIDNPEIDVDGLMQYITAPDFPLGGIIYGYKGVSEAYHTGRGSIIIRGETTIEEDSKGHNVIIVHSLPYAINKAEMIKRQAQLVTDKKIEGIADIHDESTKDIRIVYILKHDAVPNVVLNKLFQMSELQSSFAVNNIALVKGRPQLLNLRDLIQNFIEHREEVVTRRTRFELAEAEKRAHILSGLLKAIDIIDDIIALIRASQSVDEARQGLIDRYQFTELQARAIVEMRLRQLTGLEREKLQDEYDEKMKFIRYCEDVLASEELQMGIIKDETMEMKEKYGDARRTEIALSADECNPEDFYADEDVVITISHLGYIKRTSLTEYKTQNRGGVGMKGSATRDEDFIEHIYVANMHSTMLLFTQSGRCYWLKVYQIPEGSRASKGRAIQNVLSIPDDKILAYINVKTLNDEDYLNNTYIVMATKNGIIKKTSLEAYSRPRTKGINAITIREGDELLDAVLTNGNEQILIAAKNGRCVRFNEDDARPLGRTASGVRGINVATDDEAIGMLSFDPNAEDSAKHTVLVVSENGYGKRTDFDEYRITSRGSKGVKTLNITEKTGKLVAIKNVTDENDLMIINRSGLTIRMSVSDIRVAGRATQGVRLINIKDGDAIAAVSVVDNEKEDDTQAEEAVNNETDNNNNDNN